VSDPGGYALRPRFEPGTTVDDLEAYMAPFVATLGYKFNTDSEFVGAVMRSEIEILGRDGDVFCP
jgi:ferredoxin-thioredoxin reductase catalytic subunit